MEIKEVLGSKKFAFKGFKKDWTCNRFQYKEGEVYVHDGTIELCRRGFHFCYKLNDVFNYYSRSTFEENIFAIIEPLGKVLTGNDKSVTDKLKIHRQLTKDEINEVLKYEDEIRLDNDVFKLDIIQELQKHYNFSIGGSCALHLQGLTLERINSKSSVDFDVVMPYFQKLMTPKLENENDDDADYEIEEFGGKPSGNDYSKTYALTWHDGRFVKIDVKIAPEQSYEVVKYKGVEYKVCDIFTILEAKMRYAMQGDVKHRKDIMSLLKFKNSKPNDNDKDSTPIFGDILKQR